MVIFHGYVSHNQMVSWYIWWCSRPGLLRRVVTSPEVPCPSGNLGLPAMLGTLGMNIYYINPGSLPAILWPKGWPIGRSSWFVLAIFGVQNWCKARIRSEDPWCILQYFTSFTSLDCFTAFYIILHHVTSFYIIFHFLIFYHILPKAVVFQWWSQAMERGASPSMARSLRMRTSTLNTRAPEFCRWPMQARSWRVAFWG